MKKFKIIIAGDTSLGYYYIDKSRTPEHQERLAKDPMSYFRGVSRLVRGADEVIVNLETVLSKTPGALIPGKEYPGLDDPETTLQVLKELGVTAVTMANNHAMDHGEEKLKETLRHLRGAGISVVGAGGSLAEASAPYVVTLKGLHGQKNLYLFAQMRPTKRYVDYGFFAQKDKPGINSTDLPRLKLQIENIRKTDPGAIVVVCPHWQGFDYKPAADELKKISRQIADAGADVVIAHGTHRADEVENYKGVTIAHSLGNFVFNSQGRYAAKKAPPLSLIARLDIVEGKGSWAVIPSFTPIMTDNRENGFKARPLLKEEAARHKALLATLETAKPRSVLSSLPLQASAESGETDTAARGQDELAPKYSIDQTILSQTEGFVELAKSGGRLRSVGSDYRIKTAKENFLLVVTDEDWPARRRVQSGQSNLTLGEVVKQAISNKVAGLIIKDTKEARALKAKVPLVLVKNTHDYYAALAEAVRARYQGKIVAVTGSSGKSTTVEMIHGALRRLSKTSDRTTSNSNRLHDIRGYTTRLKPARDFYVLEMAASALGTQTNASCFVAPHVAIITSLAPSHLDDLGDLEKVAVRKANIFAGLSQSGLALICRDIPHFSKVSAVAAKYTKNIITYGRHKAADIRLISYSYETGKVQANFQGSKIEYNMGSLGTHMVVNSLATLAALKGLGLDWKEAASTMGEFSPVRGRGQVFSMNLQGREITVIDEAYNANPLSMRASLEVLGAKKIKGDGRRVAVLGDMLELGAEAQAHHISLKEAIENAGIDRVYLMGDMMAQLWGQLKKELRGGYATNLEQLRILLEHELLDSDLVLFKASNGSGLHEIVSEWKKSVSAKTAG